MPAPVPSCSGCSTRPPPPSARSPTPAPPPASTANTPRRSHTPTDRAPDPATQLTMKDGRRIPPGRNASAADPFYWLEREELHCTTLATKGVAMRRFGLAATPRRRSRAAVGLGRAGPPDEQGRAAQGRTASPPAIQHPVPGRPEGRAGVQHG